MVDFPRSVSDKPWLQRYKHYQERNDLLPFWYATDWFDMELEEGAGDRVTINIGDDFWMYDVSFRCQGNVVDELEPLVTFPMVAYPAFEWRLRPEGNLAWGSWIDGLLPFSIHAELRNQYGEGWVLDRGSFVTIEFRRIVAQNPERQTAQRGQFVVHGCKLAPKGAATLPSGWRNQTMHDWASQAVLNPYRYAKRIAFQAPELLPALSHAPMELRTRDRDFILERIMWGRYSTEQGEEEYGFPYVTTGQPAAVTLQVQDIPWHNPAAGGITSFAFSKSQITQAPENSRELRIPRLIRANSLMRMEVGYAQWATPDFDDMGDMFCFIAGHEIIGDSRRA